MSSRCRELAALAFCVILLAGADAAAFRVCADPDNLPFSHQDESGFENRIARLLAQSLGAELTYFWWPHRRGFLRTTLDAGVCDVVIGMPVGSNGVRTTQPYYRSRYVFVQTPKTPPVVSFDDPRLKALSIGVVLPGNDMAATPPADALARRRIVGNVHGYTLFGDRPVAQRIVDDVAGARLDIGILWGPQAGYFADREQSRLTVTPIARDSAAAIPFEFAIAMAVRRDDASLVRELDAAIDRMRSEIDAVLREYGVPRTDVGTTTLGEAR